MTGQISDLPAILNRLEKLERQNRRMRKMWLVVLVFIAAGLVLGPDAQQGRSVQAEQFIVVDTKDQPRAVLSSNSDGSVTLRISDANQKKAAELAVSTAAVSLALGGDDSKAHALLTVQATGAAAIRLEDANRKPRCAMTLAETGDTYVSLHDTQGTTRAALAVLAKEGEGSVSVNLYDPTGKQIWLAPRPPTPPKK